MAEIHFQTSHLGWRTDDFLVIGKNGLGQVRRLAGQVKRTLTIGAGDDEFKQTIVDSWDDFKNPSQFSPAADRFALVTLRGTNTLLEHFAGLLDCARAARDAAAFEHRLATQGFLNAKSVKDCDEICSILSASENRHVSAADIWPFLRVLHILSLDLNSSTSQTEAQIKSLLAHATQEPNPLGAAEASWNALLRDVGQGMPQARSYRWDDLPGEVRQRHAASGGAEQRALQALTAHSGIILDGIRSTIGPDFHLPRNQLVQRIMTQLESAPVVLVSGAAGSGKSAIAKDAVGILAADHFAFCFRAEEFECPHLDETLQKSQIPASGQMLRAILAGQARKVVLVESVERLLEASTRDAFTDLLMLAARDASWQIILTCRDYSTDLVRTGLLEPARIGHLVVTIPPLEEGELEEAVTAYPALARPIANEAMRRLLRNPYVLDKALQISWSEGLSLPQNERDFRSRFWKDIIRDEPHAGLGMPRRREETFIQIALRRARALALYARCDDLDPGVVDVLRRGSLVVSSRQSDLLVAPAHDVLEDWAILQWIDEQHALTYGSIEALSSALGTHPAVRRTYRKWVSELVERDLETANQAFRAVVSEDELSAQFRDDTLASLLRSPASTAFLESHRDVLFANEKNLLRRIIHLLRVACVTTSTWLGTATFRPSQFNVPEGPAWACILRLIHSNLDLFGDGDRSLLLGLIEDWARGVTWQAPYPEGAESVAAIAHWLLGDWGEYGADDHRKRTFSVIAKIPNADRERFIVLLRGDPNKQRRDGTTREFREIVLDGSEGMPAARDLPEVLIAAAKDHLLCTEAELHSEWFHDSIAGLETLFGIKPGREHGYFPASAYQGPFRALLQYHPREALVFIIDLFNHSADWYAHPRVIEHHVELPFEVTLTFADGSARKQWTNARLWQLYRGMHVGPGVLQCVLMALEQWLLEFAEARPRELDLLLLHVLHQSGSGAVTAVVASVATAHPHASGETLLVLLRSPQCIQLDRERHRERQGRRNDDRENVDGLDQLGLCDRKRSVNRRVNDPHDTCERRDIREPFKLLPLDASSASQAQEDGQSRDHNRERDKGAGYGDDHLPHILAKGVIQKGCEAERTRLDHRRENGYGPGDELEPCERSPALGGQATTGEEEYDQHHRDQTDTRDPRSDPADEASAWQSIRVDDKRKGGVFLPQLLDTGSHSHHEEEPADRVAREAPS